MRKQGFHQLLALVIAIAVVLMGFGPFPVAAQGEQVVVEIGAGPKINPGECTIVEWFVEMPSDWTVTLDGDPVEPRGHREVCPRVTTTYTLQVEAPGGPISKQATVVVGEGPAGEALTQGEGPPIYFQVVAPDAIPRGTCATLVWEVGGETDGIIAVNGEEAPPVGSMRVCPEESARYELIVERPESPERPEIREIILQVIDVQGEGEPWEGKRPPEGEASPPEWPSEVAVSFTSDPDAVPRGGCATLLWEVNPPGEWGIILDGELVADHGSRQVCPENTTTHELLVEIPTGSIVRHVTVHVGEEPGEAVGPTAMPPAQPTQPPSSKPGGPAQDKVDLAVTDLFADKDVQGTVHLRITNNGPAVLNNARVEVKCGNQGTPLGNQQPWSHTESPSTVSLSLNPGETSTLPTAMIVDTSQYTYDAWCSVRPLDHTESNDQNNRYAETIKRVGAAQPPPPPAPPKPPAKPSGADVHPSDLYIESGALIMRITNDGPDTLTDKKVVVTVSGCGAAREHILNLAPGETRTTDTYCQPAAGKKSYTVTVKAKDFSDPNGGNDSYTETLDAGGGSAPVPPGSSSWGVLTADLAVTDLFPDNAPRGGMMVRFTNRGPDAINNVVVPVTCQVIRHLAGGGGNPVTESKDLTAHVTLNKGQTGAYFTGIDLYQDLFWYEAKCTIKPGWKDENTGNNSYQENIKAPGP